MMSGFRDLSIRKKLTIIVSVVSAVAVFVACLGFYIFTINQYRQTHLEDLESLAGMAAYNCEAALAFNVPEDAIKVLESLKAKHTVIYARILNADNKVFASFVNPETPYGPRLKVAELNRQLDLPEEVFTVSHDVFVGNSKVGELQIYESMDSINRFRTFAISILAVVVCITILLAVLFASRLQRLISRPILALGEVSRRVSDGHDFSIRAEKFGEDEIGQLVNDFNTMLAQIQEREAALIESEKRFRTVVDQAVDSFILHDHEGMLIDVNRRACEGLGYLREELLTMKVTDIDVKERPDGQLKRYWESLSLGGTITLESVHRRKDGSVFPVEVRLGHLVLGKNSYIMALVRDITERQKAEVERVKLETQLIQAQKMESIGTLAGGIAHDFNNILTAIIGYAELAKYGIIRGAEISEKIEEILRAGYRARDLVKQILTFSRQSPKDRSVIKVHLIVKEAMKLLHAIIPRSIEIRQNIDPECGSIIGDPTQIHQILMNLCTNAYHALKDSAHGVLGVSLSQVTITAADATKILHLTPGRYVRLEVSDTGHGMDRKTVERIFEPYFTTKAQGEGTGLGLSVVHGIVKSYEGHITVYSEPGKGTTFHVYLPLAETRSGDELSGFEEPRTGHERILLIDDEEQIIRMEQEMLEGLGYQVTIFSKPLEALEKFLERPHDFDLIITDMAMPKMTGTELARAVLTIRPGIPVVLCTGFSESINEESAKAMGIKEFIMKPIIRSVLASVVYKALRAAGTLEK